MGWGAGSQQRPQEGMSSEACKCGPPERQGGGRGGPRHPSPHTSVHARHCSLTGIDFYPPMWHGAHCTQEIQLLLLAPVTHGRQPWTWPALEANRGTSTGSHWRRTATSGMSLAHDAHVHSCSRRRLTTMIMPFKHKAAPSRHLRGESVLGEWQTLHYDDEQVSMCAVVHTTCCSWVCECNLW